MDDCRSAVPGERVPCEAVGAALAVQARSVVDAPQAVALVRVTDPRRFAEVCVPTAVTGNADAVGVVEAIATLLTVMTLVLWLALVADGLATFVQGTAARGGHAGTGAGDTDVCHGSAGLSVEIIPAALTAGSFCVTLAVVAGA